MSNNRRRLAVVLAAGLAVAGACGDKTHAPPAGDLYPNCILRALPLTGTANAPVLTAAILECQGTLINMLATVVDPQGDADLLTVVQRIRVFETADCNAAFRDVTDDFAGSGLEESFGIVFEQSSDPAVFARICAASSWPIEVEFSDASGDSVSGQVLATVRH